MKEALAQSFIVGLILFFFGILLILYFGTVNYSKAFKAKNRIINIIEKYGDVAPNDTLTFTDDTTFLTEIENNLADGGYQTIKINGDDNCKKYVDTSKGDTLVYPTDNEVSVGRAYDFCLIKKQSSAGPYYQVITFMKFDFPIIGGAFRFPVRGETRVLCENIDICAKKYLGK